MKSAKRTLALFVSVLMVATALLSVGAFAAVDFPDVETGYPYKNAIYALADKGVINGIQQEDGSFLFKPEATITRAEFAKMIAVAVTGNAPLSETTAKFPDVAEDHWANKYIAYAVKAGIINGNSDGTFRPENPVTYGEAVKMIVCAKGYASLVKPVEGEPWYQCYIKVANDVNITKNAVTRGDAEASRGMVAQLVYNMDYAKKVDMGSAGGGPSIDLGEDDEYEEESGVITAVFENTLTGETYGLNKFQIMVGDQVYNLGDGLNIDNFYRYLGVMIDFEYSETGSKRTIERVTEYGSNDVLVISAENLDSVSSSVIEYYKDENANKVTEAKLSDDLYVIYNGQGVPKSDITSSFIREYFDIDCGEIRLENNDGGRDFEIAYITSYETFYVTGRTANKDLYTFNDSYKGKSVVLENNDDDYIVEKVTTPGGSKSSSTVSGISSSKVVLSVAKPLSDGVTNAIVSTATLKNAEVDEMSGYDDVVIDGKKYVISDYYMELVEEDEGTYGLSVGDKATFYLDYAGRIVFMTRSETTEPYAYVLGFDSGSGLDGKKAIKMFAISGSSGSTVEYPIKDTVKVNGNSMDSSSLEGFLKANATTINGKLKDSGYTITHGDYSQLVKYATANVDGEAHLSEIYTINYENLERGAIVPAPFRTAGGGEKTPFSAGKGLKYNTSSKAFADDGGSNQFVINSSTAVILVPSNRADDTEYKKRTNTYFNNGTKYIVEPYDVKNNIAKAVLVYTTGTNAATVSSSTDAVFIQAISSAKNDTTGEVVNKITYIKAGDPATSVKTILTSDLGGVVSGIKSGDIVKLAVDDGEVTKIQKVFVGGVLYDYDEGDRFDTYPSEDNKIVHASGNDDDYYIVVHGTVDSVAVDDGTLNVAPVIVDDNADYNSVQWDSFSISSNTKFYLYSDDDDEFSTEADLGSLNAAVNGDSVDAVNASKVVVILMGTNVKAVYILDTNF